MVYSHKNETIDVITSKKEKADTSTEGNVFTEMLKASHGRPSCSALNDEFGERNRQVFINCALVKREYTELLDGVRSLQAVSSPYGCSRSLKVLETDCLINI